MVLSGNGNEKVMPMVLTGNEKVMQRILTGKEMKMGMMTGMITISQQSM